MNAQIGFDRMPANIETLRVPPHDIAAEQAVLGDESVERTRVAAGRVAEKGLGHG